MRPTVSRRQFLKKTVQASASLGAAGGLISSSALAANDQKKGKTLLLGTAAVCIDPKKFPVIRNGSFLQAYATEVIDSVYARALVIDNGECRLALAVADVCILETPFCNSVKNRIEKKTGIPASNISISATHTHTGGSTAGGLGSDMDRDYAKQVGDQLVEVVTKAAASKKVPARVGWASVDDRQDTNCRVWIHRSDKIGVDPFGEKTIKAMMHPGHENPDYIGPCGPIDPAISMLAFQSLDGKPLAMLANYSMHYFGAKAISPDYYGDFCNCMAENLGMDSPNGPGIVMISQGTSGDSQWMDYGKPREKIDKSGYAKRVASYAMKAYKTIEYHDWVPLEATLEKVTIGRRVPDDERLAWARKIVNGFKGRPPKNMQEVYAREAIFLHDDPKRNVLLQAMRIGDLGVAMIPSEVYGITGLKLKMQSPFAVQMNMELTNGSEGYIPPPELHPFGGYNTWPARSAALVPDAETEIVEAELQMLEKLAGRSRQAYPVVDSPYCAAVKKSDPKVYWRMHNIDGQICPDDSPRDSSRGSIPGRYEPCVAYYLDGPDSSRVRGDARCGLAAHFAGGRLGAEVEKLGNDYTAEAWVWNGFPAADREMAGYFFSRGENCEKSATGDHLGIGGTITGGVAQNRLAFMVGDDGETLVAGKTEIPLKEWAHVALVRKGDRVELYLNGKLDGSGTVARLFGDKVRQIYFGGRSDNRFNFEGKISEAAVYDRALSAQEIATHYQG
jgi:Concanavalin A-like lectin/glucanases superfamily